MHVYCPAFIQKSVMGGSPLERTCTSRPTSFEADAAPARGHEDEVLGEDGGALGFARHLAKGLPSADDVALEVLFTREAGGYVSK